MAGFNNNPGLGLGSWVKLSTDDTWVAWTNFNEANLLADLPPGVVLSAPPVVIEPPPGPTDRERIVALEAAWSN